MQALLDAGLMNGDVPDRDRPDHGREPRRHRPAGPRRQGAAGDDGADPPHRRPDDPAGDRWRPEGAVVKTAGFDSDGLRGHRAGLRRRAGRHGRGRGRHARRPATSWSSATRARRAVRACARCSPSPARSRAPASARTCCCSPTAGSPAARPACASATSRPEAVDGGPIALRAATATASGSTSPRARSTSLVDAQSLAAAREGFTPPAPKYTTGVLAKYRKLVGSAAAGRGLRLTRGSLARSWRRGPASRIRPPSPRLCPKSGQRVRMARRGAAAG